ncbi:quinone oxidoreductase family protein [Streptacidiphilus albus]|uniref:quinone oxidoreductase family protein n=1 Tax=Streptacidiphilus albus TaxID=105425 RepID=UPI00054B8F6B|nr:zinc-binding alcohol dehydrogenase family protein [Streptacidiphilus albus]
MQAAIVKQLGQAPSPGERPEPQPTPGRTLVRVTAASINPVDLHISSGTHPAGPPPLGHVPGVEGVGTVVAGGSLPAGTRVRVAVLGGYQDGTFAELVSAPDAACVPLPDGLDDGLAAAVGIVGVSALIALRDEAGLRPGESVLVLGATGGFGQALVHLARELGAGRVVAAGRTPARLAALADRTDGTLLLEPDAAAEEPSWFASRLERLGGPVDVVVDTLWGAYAPLALAALRSGGRYLNLGQTAGSPAPVDAALLRHGGLRLSGFSAAALPPERVVDAYREVAGIAARGALDLPLAEYPLAEVGAAWAAQGASPGAKIVLRP